MPGLASLPKTTAAALAVACVVASLVTSTGVAWAQGAQQPSAPPPGPPPPPPAPTSGQPAAAPPPGDRPPAHYYVEPASPAGPAQPAQPPPSGPPVHEPPPPGYGYAPTLVYEPPPPPVPRHIAPKYSFWLGARIGWFVPFGDLWADCTVPLGANDCGNYEGVAFSDYASSGPLFELDVGARLGRNYNLFLLWEHAELGRGSLDPDARGEQEGADTDFFALALRVSSNPDKVGFLTEIALGARRMRTHWDSGAELQLTDAPFEARLGLGADIRMGPAFSLSPLITLGVGAFGEVKDVAPDGTSVEATDDRDARTGHGWLTLQIGGHFDIGGGG